MIFFASNNQKNNVKVIESHKCFCPVYKLKLTLCKENCEFEFLKFSKSQKFEAEATVFGQQERQNKRHYR